MRVVSCLHCHPFLRGNANLQIVFTPGLVSSIYFYSGILFTLLCSLPPVRLTAKRRREAAPLQPEAIAMGGRYDRLISHFQHPERRPAPSAEPRPAAVGFLMALERLAGLELDRESGSAAEPAAGKGVEVRVPCEGDAQEARALRFAKKVWEVSENYFLHY